MKTTVTIFISILIIISNLHSQGISFGQEFQVNTYTDFAQINAAVAGLSDGGFVVCWQGFFLESSEYLIFGQIYDSSATKQGTEFQVNTYTESDQIFPTVAGLSDGGFVVCWVSNNQDGSDSGIFGQIFNAAGNKVGVDFQVNTCTQLSQDVPTVASFSDGGFIVCWMSGAQEGRGEGIFGQMFDAGGGKKGDEFQVIGDDYQNNQSNPKAAALLDGGFVVCWDSSGSDIREIGILGQLFDRTGAKKGDEFQVNTSLKNTQFEPAISALSDGGFVVCWIRGEPGSPEIGVFGQIFNAQGVKIGTEFQASSHTQIYSGAPAVAGLPHGDFVVCWVNTELLVNPQDVFGQIFNSSGGKNGPEFQVNTYTQDAQNNTAIASLSNDRFVACWESKEQDGDDYGIFGKIFRIVPIIHQLQEYSLIEPLNDMTLDTNRPNFRWQQPSSIQECYSWELTFDLYLDTGINFSHPQIIKNIQDTTYSIDSLAAGKTYFWKVLAKNLAGDSLWSTQQDWGFFIKPGATLVESFENELPQHFELFQNYSNPFNSSTEIKYSLPNTKANHKVQLKIYDVLGRLVKVLVDQEQSAGSYAISWDGTDLNSNRAASGVYLYSLHAGDFKSIRKMLVLQ